MATLNPHTSMMFHDPSSRDLNQYQAIGSMREKGQLIEQYLAKWAGKQVPVIHNKSGEVRTMEFNLGPTGRPSRRSRVQVIHLLFGDWRLATPEDLERQNAKDKVVSERIARIEADKAAQKAGLMFESLSRASDAINKFQGHDDADRRIEALQVQVAELAKLLEEKGKKKAPAPAP